jgi:hypothetical protein
MSIGFTAKLERPAHSAYNGSALALVAGQRTPDRERFGEPQLAIQPMDQFKVWDGRLMMREARSDGIAFWQFVKAL